MGGTLVDMPAMEKANGNAHALESSNIMPATNGSGEASDVVFGDMNSSVNAVSAAVNGVVVKGGWNELPHNMGILVAKPDASQSGTQENDKPEKAVKKRAPAKPRAKKDASATASRNANHDEDAADEAADVEADGALIVGAKPAPKKRAPRKKAAAKEAPDEDLEMADVMQEAFGAVVDTKPAPKKRAPRKNAAPKTASTADREAVEANVKAEEDGNDADVEAVVKLEPITPAKTSKTRAPAKQKAGPADVKTEGDGDETVNAAATESSSKTPKTPKPRAPRKKVNQQPSPADSVDNDAAVKNEAPKITITRKRAKKEDGEESDFEEQKPKRKRASRAKKVDTSDDVLKQVDKLIDSVEGEAKVKKPKAAKYGLTPGISPYPDWPLPTAEACYEVNKLLSDVHGVVEQPAVIPPPSLEITGCGEVPSVLDALIRTRLSAATTSTNSAYAFAGLVEKFGVMDSGIGKGSIDWNKVRVADVKDIEEAIKRGGLAKTKSESIKGILLKVYEDGQARHEALKKEKEEGVKADVLGADTLPQSIKDLEIASAEQDVLSLQYMHGLDDVQAMEELTKYPGIGAKTASCVILFCLRRPSFAVDTHIFRLCKWLKWIPENATRDKTFSHCEVRIPSELKYSLHQLFIRHGKTCGRCRAITGQSSEAWENANCPIEHLVTRTGVRKMFKPTPEPTKKKGKKGKKGKKADDEDTESELSEHEDDEFEDLLSGESDQLPQSPEGNDEGNVSEAEAEIHDENMADAEEDEAKEGTEEETKEEQ